jgi:type I restriction enzyme S subunit
VADEVAVAVTHDIKRCARLRQAVLKWAFEGKLVDQDPTDEPAEKLLARIRAERAAVNPVRKTLGRRARGAA